VRQVSRRSALRIGVGGALAAAGAVALPGTAGASGVAPVPGTDEVTPPDAPAAVGGRKVRNLTGPEETGAFAAPWTDLGIPVRCPDGSVLLVCGDSFAGSGVGAADWRAPIALRCPDGAPDALLVTGSVGGAHAEQLVPEGHIPLPGGNSTAIPSDAFTIGDTMYLHLMRGVIHQTEHSDLWRSRDNGNTWEYLCKWPGNQYAGQFQQKTYAVAQDGYCYVLSTAFNRDTSSGLLLHRVPHARVGEPAAYEPWGFADGAWRWGNPPTTVARQRKWGEICFRAMGGKYALTWLNLDPVSIRAQVFALPTSNLYETPEQTMITATAPGKETATAVAHPYGGFIVPGSTFADFHITVSQWYDAQNYRVMQYRITGLAS